MTSSMSHLTVPSVCFFVIAYGQERILDQCLNRLTSLFSPKHIWLIDNASPKSLESVARKYHIRFNRQTENKGYSGGCNAAIRIFSEQSKADTCCLLNSDVFFDKKFVSQLPNELIRLTFDPKLALIQPVLYMDIKKSKVENNGIRYFQSGLAFQSIRDSGRVVVNGACMLLKRKAVDAIVTVDGFCFEEVFWSYAEDVELSLRLLSRGFKIDVSPILSAQHLGSVSFGRGSSRSRYLYARNLFWTLCIAWKAKLLQTHAIPIIVGQLRLLVEFMLSGELSSYFKLLHETWRNRKILMEKRRNFQSKNKHDFTSYLQPGSFPVRR